MKNFVVILFCFLFFVGCRQENLNRKSTAFKYFNARNSVEFVKIKELINDSIIITEGDYIMPYSRRSYYEFFKWDSIFQPTYEIVELKEIEDYIIASISHTSIRNTFLQNELMTCQYKLSFDAGKISKIESLDCQNVNWELWQNRVEALVSWIDNNYPELNGFVHDMTMNGAQNYLKAIQLYEENN